MWSSPIIKNQIFHLEWIRLMGNNHFYERLRACRTRFQCWIMHNNNCSYQFSSERGWISRNIFLVKNAIRFKNGKRSVTHQKWRIGKGRDAVKNVENENEYLIDYTIISVKIISSETNNISSFIKRSNAKRKRKSWIKQNYFDVFVRKRYHSHRLNGESTTTSKSSFEPKSYL